MASYHSGHAAAAVGGALHGGARLSGHDQHPHVQAPHHSAKASTHTAYAVSHHEEHRPSGGLFTEINKNIKNQGSAESDALAKAESEVFKDDIFGKIAKSKRFEFTTLGFICLNALAIGFDADYSARYVKPKNLYEGPVVFILIENMFATYFTAEVLLRFIAYKSKVAALKDVSFLFDAVLVGMMVMETWVLPFFGDGGPFRDLSILRLVRLLRITRMARLMRSLPELLIIVRGMVAAVRAVAWTVILLMVFTFTFSILFTNEFHVGNTPEEDETDEQSLFGSMGRSFFSLIIMGTILDDVTVLTNGVRGTNSWMAFIAVLVFILVSAFMLANMLLGILVEVVGISADTEKAVMKADNFRDAVQGILSKMDEDTDKFVTESEFMAMRDNPEVRSALKDLGVERTHFYQYGSLLFGEHRHSAGGTKGPHCGLTYSEITDMMLRLTPGVAVSALDLAAMGNVMLTIRKKLNERVERALVTSEQCLESLTAPDTGAGGEPTSAAASAGGGGDESGGVTGGNEAAAGRTGGGPRGPGPRMASAPLEADAGSNAARRIGPDTLARLARFPSDGIIRELSRRIGITDFSGGVPFSMLDEEMQRRARDATNTSASATPTPPLGYCRPNHVRFSTDENTVQVF